MSAPPGADGFRVRDERPGGGLRRFFLVVGLVLAILWGAVFVALRTPGGITLLETRLAALLAEEVRVTRAGLAFPLTLWLEDVYSADFVPGFSGFRIREGRLSPGGHPRGRMHLKGLELVLRATPNGGWMPPRLGAIGDLPAADIRALSDACGAWRERWRLDIEDGHILWVDDGGAPLAEVQGLVFRVAPVALPDRRAYVHQLHATRVVDGGRDTLAPVALEWLWDGSGRYVELLRSAALPPADGAGFWSVQDGDAYGR